MISSGVNDIEIKSNKEHDNNKPRSSQIFMSDPNNINILAQPNQKIRIGFIWPKFFINSIRSNKIRIC